MIFLPLTVWLLGADHGHGHGQVKSSWTNFHSCFEKWDFEKENMFFLGLATRGQDHPLLHSFCGKLKHLQIQTRKCQNIKDKTQKAKLKAFVVGSQHCDCHPSSQFLFQHPLEIFPRRLRRRFRQERELEREAAEAALLADLGGPGDPGDPPTHPPR